jgi:hypothetical protein
MTMRAPVIRRSKGGFGSGEVDIAHVVRPSTNGVKLCVPAIPNSTLSFNDRLPG